VLPAFMYNIYIYIYLLNFIHKCHFKMFHRFKEILIHLYNSFFFFFNDSLIVYQEQVEFSLKFVYYFKCVFIVNHMYTLYQNAVFWLVDERGIFVYQFLVFSAFRYCWGICLIITHHRDACNKICKTYSVELNKYIMLGHENDKERYYLFSQCSK
jgi:hypothetical protein